MPKVRLVENQFPIAGAVGLEDLVGVEHLALAVRPGLEENSLAVVKGAVVEIARERPGPLESGEVFLDIVAFVVIGEDLPGLLDGGKDQAAAALDRARRQPSEPPPPLPLLGPLDRPNPSPNRVARLSPCSPYHPRCKSRWRSADASAPR